MPLSQERSVVVASLITWRSLFQRPQQLVTHWPGYEPIVFIEPWTNTPGNALFPEHTDYGWRLSVPLIPITAKSARVRKVFHFLAEDLGLRWVFELIMVLHVRLMFLLFNLPTPGLLIIESPQYLPLLRSYDKVTAVFDYMDDLLEFRGVPSYFRDYLVRALRFCHKAIATSEPLRERLREFSALPVEVIGNGVEVDHFSRERNRSQARPEILALPGRKIVYAGTIAYWMNFAALRSIAEAFPEDTLVLIGPVYEEVRAEMNALLTLPNVREIGAVPYADLPSYTVACDVALIPFLENDLTYAVNPNKAYEYAATGLPFVSTALPPMQDFVGVVPLLETGADWAAAVGELLTLLDQPEALEALRRNLAGIAAANSWESKMERFAIAAHM